MKNFLISMEYYNGILFITEENTSGASYEVETTDDVMESILDYFEKYIVE